MARLSDLGQALTLTDLHVSWRALMLTSDALSSRFSLERRSPYLCRDLMEFAYAMPLHHKLPSAGDGKALLRDAAGQLGLPKDLCRPRDKLGFSSPVPQWLNGTLEPWCLEQIHQSRNLVPAGILRAVLDRGQHSCGPYDRHRTQALMTAVWLLDHHGASTASSAIEGLAHAS
jgi:asparagine synthase (glutamine-hydrolysing)